MHADAVAAALVERVRARPWGVATVAIVGDDNAVRVDKGDDPLDEHSTFQIGSVTKAMTGVLLADAIVRGEASIGTTLADALAIDGAAAEITLAELATQRSGLLRLPPNLTPATVDLTNPYGAYTEADLRGALATVELGPRQYEYSNFGFMTLGLALRELTGSPMPDLLRERLFEPLGMTSAGCPPGDANRVPGHAGTRQTCWWTTQLPGAGGVGASITDMAAWLRAHVDPPPGALGEAITLATTGLATDPALGFGWGCEDGVWWHNGATGGFKSLAGFHRETRTGVCLLANSADADMLDRTGFDIMRDLMRRSSSAL